MYGVSAGLSDLYDNRDAEDIIPNIVNANPTRITNSPPTVIYIIKTILCDRLAHKIVFQPFCLYQGIHHQFCETGNSLRRRLREKVDLQEALEVQVRDLLAVLRAQELGELDVGDDAALEAGVKALVLADVRRHKLRHIRLALLALGRQAHKAGQLIGDRAEL